MANNHGLGRFAGQQRFPNSTICKRGAEHRNGPSAPATSQTHDNSCSPLATIVCANSSESASIPNRANFMDFG